jgi:hypothetical protein
MVKHNQYLSYAGSTNYSVMSQAQGKLITKSKKGWGHGSSEVFA